MIRLSKNQEQTLKDKISMLIIINSIITSTILMGIVPLLATMAYQERGYFAIGGEYIAMAFLIIAIPLSLWNYEKRWL